MDVLQILARLVSVIKTPIQSLVSVDRFYPFGQNKKNSFQQIEAATGFNKSIHFIRCVFLSVGNLPPTYYRTIISIVIFINIGL